MKTSSSATETLSIGNIDTDLDTLRISVRDLGLSTRTTNSLLAKDKKTVGDLIQLTDRQLLSYYKSFGRKSLKEVNETLAELNLSLGMTLPDDVLAAINSSKVNHPLSTAARSVGPDATREQSILERVLVIEQQISYFRNLGLCVELTAFGKVNLKKI